MPTDDVIRHNAGAAPDVPVLFQPAELPDETGEAGSLPDWVKDPVRAYREIKKVRAEAKTLREEKSARPDSGKAPETQAFESLAFQLQSENDTLRGRLAELEWSALRAKVAGEMGLPSGAASRLVGATEDELKADAETLKALLAPASQGQPPQRRSQNTTPAPSGKVQGETDEQRRARLRGRAGNSPIFDKRG